MSFHDSEQPVCTEADGAIELTIEPKSKDLGEFSVRRVLPSRLRRMVGPFIFFDHMGPAEFAPGKGISVRPHPHIGLATITYLFDGQILHRDSLGYEQAITKGAVNLMTAGKGIVHSERAGDDLDQTSFLHGIQSWMALPDDAEEVNPEFIHYAADTIPQVDVNGVTVRIIMGEAFGECSRVKQYSPTLYLECQIPKTRTVNLPGNYDELAFYVVSGCVQVGDQRYQEGVMAIACDGRELCVEAEDDARIMVIGGAPVGQRHVWWNFVSSTKDRIEQAKADWSEGRFDPVEGDDEFIPLPER